MKNQTMMEPLDEGGIDRNAALTLTLTQAWNSIQENINELLEQKDTPSLKLDPIEFDVAFYDEQLCMTSILCFPHYGPTPGASVTMRYFSYYQVIVYSVYQF
jgi:hypothetical protein